MTMGVKFACVVEERLLKKGSQIRQFSNGKTEFFGDRLSKVFCKMRSGKICRQGTPVDGAL